MEQDLFKYLLKRKLFPVFRSFFTQKRPILRCSQNQTPSRGGYSIYLAAELGAIDLFEEADIKPGRVHDLEDPNLAALVQRNNLAEIREVYTLDNSSSGPVAGNYPGKILAFPRFDHSVDRGGETPIRTLNLADRGNLIQMNLLGIDQSLGQEIYDFELEKEIVKFKN